jgi:hypothetical protein
MSPNSTGRSASTAQEGQDDHRSRRVVSVSLPRPASQWNGYYGNNEKQGVEFHIGQK